jgi:uncharacterized protein YcbX
MTGRVAWISLTPVKATAVQLVDQIELLENGLAGDRRFYLVSETGRLINNKDCGPLQLVRAEYDERADVLTLHMPDGTVVSDQVERGDEVETRFHSRSRTARLVRGPWAQALSSLVGEQVRVVDPGTGLPIAAVAAQPHCSGQRRSRRSRRCSGKRRSTSAGSG